MVRSAKEPRRTAVVRTVVNTSQAIHGSAYVTPDTLVYTLIIAAHVGKDRQTIGITARVLRRA